MEEGQEDEVGEGRRKMEGYIRQGLRRKQEEGKINVRREERRKGARNTRESRGIKIDKERDKKVMNTK